MPTPQSAIRYLIIIWPILFVSIQGCSGYRTEFTIADVLPNQMKINVLTPDERLTLLTDTLSFNQYIKGLSHEQLEIERHRLETSLETSSALARVKLALLYSLPESGFQNTARAKTLLQSCMGHKNTTRQEAYYLSSLITTFLDTHITQQKRINTIKKKLNSEQNRSRELQEQLEALKTIEKTINNRSNSLTGYNPGYP